MDVSMLLCDAMPTLPKKSSEMYTREVQKPDKKEAVGRVGL